MVDEVDKGRRAFFRRAAGKAAEHVVQEADARLEARAAKWLRPPWARPELEFVLACTRCDACIEVCPHGVIFALPASYGLDVAASPALDLLNKACHLCADWPCVAVCEPQALRLPEPEEGAEDPAEDPLPRLAHASIDTATCLPWAGPECGACEGSCPVPGALTWSGCQPSIDMAHCVGCGLCRIACITDPPSIHLKSLYTAGSTAP
jgi:ferredoxin-type protein NapG